jgi:alanine dehydrogenase
MRIGVPREHKDCELRGVLTPEGVAAVDRRERWFGYLPA